MDVRIKVNYSFLLVITPDSLLFQCKCLYLYKSHDGWVSPSAQPFWLPTIYLFIYLQYITLTDYILTVANYLRNFKFRFICKKNYKFAKLSIERNLQFLT